MESLDRLINAFTRIGGVGRKTAERYAYSIVNMPYDEAKEFANAIVEVKDKVKYCKICGNFSEQDICPICASRNSRIICVVKEPKDVVSLERIKKVNCLYHVLHGTINPLENKGPNDIRIKELIQRINEGNVDEIIMATNPDVEGEVTASYISKLVKPLGVKVTRIAQGVQMGSDLQYADEVTLSKALEDRKEY